MTGTFETTINLGSGLLNSAGSDDVFLAKLGPTGTGVWSESFGDSGDQEGGGLSVDGSGNAVIVGGCGSGNLNFGDGPLSCGGDANGDGAMYVARFDSRGRVAWGYTGGISPSLAVAVAVSADDDVALAGEFGAYTSTLDLAGTTLTSPSGAIVTALALFSP